MTIRREWATPFTMGAFLLSAATGLLLFFHLGSGLNKLAHEWLSWALLAGVGLHAISNLQAFKRHFGSPPGRALIGVFVLLFALSFIPAGGRSEPPFLVPVRALAEAPLDTLAQVAGIDGETLAARMQAAGLLPAGAGQSLADLVGPNPRRQAEVLARLLGRPAP